MSTDTTVQAELRDSFGKGYARRLRAAGKIPAVVYGHGTEPVHVALPGHQLSLLVRRANVVLELELEGKTQLTLIKDVQKDPVRQIIERWWMVAAVALAGAIAGYGLSQLNPPSYQSVSTYVIATGDSIEDPGDVAAALGVLRNRQVTATFAEILQSKTLLDRAAKETGSAGSDFESTGVVLPESNVVSLTSPSG